MPLNFPNSQSLNDFFVSGGRRWQWNGTAWQRIPDPGAQGVQGATGAGGSTGAQGNTGPTGAQGAEGNFGGATFYYTFETNTTNANPGSGDIRLDNSTQNAATGIYICDTDED